MQCCRRCEEDHYCYLQYNEHYHHSRQYYYVCNFSFTLMITVNYFISFHFPLEMMMTTTMLQLSTLLCIIIDKEGFFKVITALHLGLPETIWYMVEMGKKTLKVMLIFCYWHSDTQKSQHRHKRDAERQRLPEHWLHCGVYYHRGHQTHFVWLSFPWIVRFSLIIWACFWTGAATV